MSMPPWLRASIEPDTKTTVSTSKPKVLQPTDDPIEQPIYDPVCIIAPTAEPKDTIGSTLAEHDAKFHPNGLKPTEPCKFREALIDEPADESAAPIFQEISATPINEIQPTAETVAVKKPHKKPGRKAKK